MIKRVFIYEGKELPDIDPSMTPDEIRQHYGNFFPELYNADIKETVDKENTLFTFNRRIGTKSDGVTIDNPTLIKVLRSVREHKLKLFKIACSVPIKDGRMDDAVLSAKAVEIEAAISEASSYIKECQELINRLRVL